MFQGWNGSVGPKVTWNRGEPATVVERSATRVSHSQRMGGRSGIIDPWVVVFGPPRLRNSVHPRPVGSGCAQIGFDSQSTFLMQPILDSRKLLAFVALARCGSFTQTAREIYLTQSAVSHAIKSLEEELDCRLFDRLGRTTRLTPAGLRLHEYAIRILDEMEHARAELKALEKPSGLSAPAGVFHELAGR